MTSDNRPAPDSCWRFSFREHQHICKQSGGFMLQIVEAQMECDDDWEGVVYKLGNGQKIETLMAHQESLKVFRIWQGVGRESHSSQGFRDRPFDDDDADYVASVVQRWYAFG